MYSYHTDDALRRIQGSIEQEWDCHLSISDVSAILHYQEAYYDRISHTGMESDLPVVHFIRLQASSDGLRYTVEAIRAVLEAEYAYFQDIPADDTEGWGLYD